MALGRFFRWGVGLFVLAVGFIGLLFVVAMWLSLPKLEGEHQGLVQYPVTVERDADGRVTITGKNREDVAWATGFIHAQERFFQMDLMRRRAAGELADLLGPVAVDADKRWRMHRLRSRVQRYYAKLPKWQRNILQAYTKGVNAGLDALGTRPVPYWVLRAAPKRWQPEDSLLVVASMYIELQDEDGEQDWQRYLLRKAFGAPVEHFLSPEFSPFDAPIDDLNPSPPKIQPPKLDKPLKLVRSADSPASRVDAVGSNNWAVSGSLTDNGIAMLEDDMHLGLTIPATWFYARLKVIDTDIDISGVTLPGVPAVVVGSNRHIAWGYTNSYGDWGDLIALKTNPENTQYLTPKGWLPFKKVVETIHVKGGAPIQLEILETIWGPVLKRDDDKYFAFHWVLYHPQSLNANILRLETAKNVDEALQLAPNLGMPQQNALIVDRNGDIAWTIFGPIPNKIPGDYRHPGDWSTGTLGWRGFLDLQAHPKLKNPPHGRLWSANGRTVSGQTYRKIGDGGFVLGARQQQIRDRLMAMQAPITHRHLYQLSLDDEARLLQRWAKRAYNTAMRLSHPAAPRIGAIIERWDGHAHADSVAYRLIRTFRDALHATVVDAINGACREVSEACNYWRLGSRREIAVWALLEAEPLSWLPEGVDSWQELEQRAALSAWQSVLAKPETLKDWTWGRWNQTQIHHPIMRHVPVLARVYAMPKFAQSGDWFMPKVAQPAFGQSQRLVVQPGNEQAGLFNLPVGQSAHPWSPYFGRMHVHWAKGKPQSFWPGATQWTLRFIPER